MNVEFFVSADQVLKRKKEILISVWILLSDLSKSYGFVEFDTEDMVRLRQIQQELDWKELGSQQLHCDFVEPAHQNWDKLQSRCLFLCGLPKTITDISKLREFCSVVCDPVYCQVWGHHFIFDEL